MAIKLRADAIRSVAFGSITSSYTPLGIPLEFPASVIKITNNTDALLMFSFTGNTDHLIYPTKTADIYDFTANKRTDDGWFVQTGTKPSIKYVGAAPTTGSVYLSVIYGLGGV